ncbi:gamma-glutamylcyclotransferase family protein [Vreelandella aquamarina]|uniref:gamma-glutamylcyclotransferase family protein n=1 Tax=Vreelandella aquamarina TaxID=77097 RepID=UPI00384FDF85
MVWFKRLVIGALLSLLGCLLGLAIWLWLTMLSPWFYDRPEHLPDIEQRTHRVFVYGTLRYLPVRWIVMGSSGSPRPARLNGVERHGLDLSSATGSHVDGLLLTVTPKELARLDRYERLGVRYERIEQRLADGTSAWVYVRLPEISQLDIAPPAHRVALVTYL